MRILAINGGGAKGMRVAAYLNAQKKGIEFADLYAGTSTGSIIASMLACGYSTNVIEKKYKDFGQSVFEKNVFRLGLFREKYDNTNLIDLVRKEFGNTKFGDLNRKLIIPVLNLTHQKVDFIRTDCEKYKDVLISDAIIASCSAPSYFKPYQFSGCTYVDGGMAVNNPSFVALIEACKLTNSLEHSITSLTTGSDVISDYEALKSWSLKDAPNLINVILNEQERSSGYYTSQIVEDYTRIEMLSNLSSGKIDDFSEKNTLLMIQEGNNTAKFNK